jgi:acetyltransferase-like isoleucine patch superfamily enzyme
VTRFQRGLRRFFRSILRPLVAALKRIDVRTSYCHGDVQRLHIGQRVSEMNTIFNVASGDIFIGDDTIFGHNCMVLTGRHEFIGGRRGKLVTGGPETPTSGSDIRIGSGCWIASGAIVTGGVTIGDNTIIGAGAVVALDIPSGVFAAGVPARVIRKLESLEGTV